MCAGSFCGVCEGNSCVELVGLSQSTCANTTACLLADGRVGTGAQCNTLASCDQPCPSVCAGLGANQGCIVSGVNETYCENRAGTWSNDTMMCELSGNVCDVVFKAMLFVCICPSCVGRWTYVSGLLFCVYVLLVCV